MMLTTTTPVADLNALGRLDAGYYLSPGAAAARRLAKAKQAGLTTRQVGTFASVWQPSRFKRAYAGRGESFVPYLAPHDAFQYLPDDTERLSLNRTQNLDRYRISRGHILQTCSGRNLGPNVIVDDVLSRFVTSHDVIRIDVDDEQIRYYLVGYLRSKTGQGLLRRDKSGSVIDHITVGHVEAQEIPMLSDRTIDRVASLIRRSFELTESARRTLADALASYEGSLPSPRRSSPAKSGWTVRASQIVDRLDAASYDPWVARVRAQLMKAGGRRVDEVAEVRKPPGRYKTIYVSEKYGKPFMSGTQILQLVPARRQFMAERAFNEVADYELREGWSVFMADGRAEKDLGVVAMVPGDRAGWLASGHVGRLIPHESTDPGWLWLAARTWQAQIQIKALASGSVVDSTYPHDMRTVILPPQGDLDGSEIVDAWRNFGKARTAEAEATELVDNELRQLTGVEDVDEEPDDDADEIPDDEADE
jgi:hypothetical protein